MALAEHTVDPPEPEPEDVPEPLAPVEVPEPAVEDTPERGEALPTNGRASSIGRRR